MEAVCIILVFLMQRWVMTSCISQNDLVTLTELLRHAGKTDSHNNRTLTKRFDIYIATETLTHS